MFICLISTLNFSTFVVESLDSMLDFEHPLRKRDDTNATITLPANSLPRPTLAQILV
jgi:hypothetical protein